MDKFWSSIRVSSKKNCAIILTATMRFAAYCISSNQSSFRYDLVWQKLRPSNFMQAKARPLSYHEHVLLFADEPPMYNPQMVSEAERRYIENAPRVQTQTYHNPFYKQKYKTMCRNSQGPMHPKSILTGLHKTKKDGFFHPTQKPLDLLEWLIKTYTNPGDTVLDPVVGSGTTGVACARLGRHFIGIEKDATYFETAAQRIDAERQGLGLPLSQRR